MATTGPVAVGTRGTVGSLLRKEMEYFSELRSSGKSQITETNSGRDGIQQKKKLLVPGICSIVDVAEMSCRREDEVPGFSYRILRGEFKDKHA